MTTDAEVAALAGIRCIGSLTVGSEIMPGSSVSSLGSLSDLEVLGDLTVTWSVTQLENLHGLEQLTALDSVVLQSEGLQDLAGLENVSTIENLAMGPTSVQTLDGLASLASVTANLQLGAEGLGNQELSSVTGLSNLSSVGGTLAILFAPNLASSLGLGGLSAVDHLRLGHTGLTEIDGLSGLQNGRVVAIYDNPDLSTCAAHALVTALSPEASLVVGNQVDACWDISECDATDVAGSGACEIDVAYHWDGTQCAYESGCECIGVDCESSGFLTSTECELAYDGC